MLSASCDGELGENEVMELEKHLAACGHCRATLRTYRAAPGAAAALAPLLPASRGLWEKTQEFAIELQMKLQGIGRNSDSGLQNLFASGGTRGAGMAAAAKLAAICAGTAGTAAVCAATGILPAPALISKTDERAPVARHRAHIPEQDRSRMVYAEPVPEPVVNPVPEPQQENVPSNEASPEVAEPAEPVAEVPVVTSTAPAPTPTETEFTPEAAGTPAPAATPPPQPQPASNPVPVGNGGGEFAP